MYRLTVVVNWDNGQRAAGAVQHRHGSLSTLSITLRDASLLPPLLCLQGSLGGIPPSILSGYPMSTQPESQLSRELIDLIRARGGFAMKIHGGPMMMSGAPDIIACYRGRYLGIETKLPHATRGATAIQRHRINQIRKAGGVGEVVRSKEQMLNILLKIDKSLP
jgi:hypothetical protein